MSNNYAKMKYAFAKDPDGLQRCATRLLAIRKRLKPLRDRKSDSAMLLATWNLRDFDSNKFKWGPRLPETFYYIAEMIACFDLVAIQEVNEDLKPLRGLMSILGHDWDYIVTDVTEGPGGNRERMAIVYHKDRVWFRRVAGEVVLPDGQLVVSPKKVNKDKQPDIVEGSVETRQQFARSPFLVAFQSGWFHFSLCTVHIYYGSESGPQLERRIDEIRKLVAFFARRQDEASPDADNLGQAENYILLGDFNVVSPDHETMKALKSNGFVVPEAIDGDKVRSKENHFYDQIATRVKDSRFKVTSGGLVQLFEDVFRDSDAALYERFVPQADPEAKAGAAIQPLEKRYKKWRTWQMSDHTPLWIEIKTDFAESYLEDLATPD